MIWYGIVTGLNLAYSYHKQEKSISLQEVLHEFKSEQRNYLFLLDVLFRNIDRTLNNHGIISVDERLIVSDFGVSLIIRSVLDGRSYKDGAMTKQLLKEHCVYSDDINDEIVEQFFQFLKAIDVSTLIRMVPDTWLENHSHIGSNDVRERLERSIRDLIYSEDTFKIFLKEVVETNPIDKKKQREKTALNKIKFMTMIDTR